MNIISRYCNKTCINCAKFYYNKKYRLIVILNCRLNYACARANFNETNAKSMLGN